ncbi:hypothetical protein BGZ54_002683, partial [Gamsiella multidivaricata]
MANQDLSSFTAITPDQRMALVNAWMVYGGIPDFGTLRFISRLARLDEKLVRYWFHCRANYDGIMHVLASAPATGIDLPGIESYHQLE